MNKSKSKAKGTSRVPPGESKQKEVRYFHIHKGDQLVEAQFATWVKQGSQMSGEQM